jgi:hypothetical protein
VAGGSIAAGRFPLASGAVTAAMPADAVDDANAERLRVVAEGMDDRAH